MRDECFSNGSVECSVRDFAPLVAPVAPSIRRPYFHTDWKIRTQYRGLPLATKGALLQVLSKIPPNCNWYFNS